jgi:signal transduction histidine kinase
VEVAAYRIATEAVTNTVRHGRATACQIRLRIGEAGDMLHGGAPRAVALHLEISDNGTGTGQPWRHGVGLRSMYERAAELGGTLTAGPTDTGCRVHAMLPLEGP